MPNTVGLVAPWRPGQSGNPAGKPKGRRNIPALIRECITEDEAVALVRRVYDEALAGKESARDWLARYELADIARGDNVNVTILAQFNETVRALPDAVLALIDQVDEGELPAETLPPANPALTSEPNPNRP